MTTTKFILAVAGVGIAFGAGMIADTILTESAKTKKEDAEITKELKELKEFLSDLGIA